MVFDGFGDDIGLFNIALLSRAAASHTHKLHAEFVRFAVR